MLRVEKMKATDMAVLGRSIALGQTLEKEEYSRSIFADEEILMCGGIAIYWQGRGELWAVVSPKAKAHAYALTKTVKRLIKDCPVKRIEAAAQRGNPKDFGWISLLGFKVESLAVSYLPDGSDAYVFSRVRTDG